MENSKGHGKSWKMMIMLRNFYYCTEQFCKSDMTSFIKSNYEPFYLFNNGTTSEQMELIALSNTAGPSIIIIIIMSR